MTIRSRVAALSVSLTWKACFALADTENWARPFLCETSSPKYKLVDIPMHWVSTDVCAVSRHEPFVRTTAVVVMQDDAKRYCEDNYQSLAAIHSDLDHEDAMNACSQRTGANPCNDRFIDGDTCRGSAGCWIGLHEPAGEGEMRWTDG